MHSLFIGDMLSLPFSDSLALLLLALCTPFQTPPFLLYLSLSRFLVVLSFGSGRYRHWQGPSSGERAVTALLQPGAFAKDPLGPHRIPALHPDLPLAFVYGATDWMDIEAARAVADAVDAQGEPTSSSARFLSVERVRVR